MIRTIKTAKYRLQQLVLMFIAAFAVSCEEYLPDGGLYDVVDSGIQEQPGSVITPEAVDLGLPSGVKWAAFNVGATKPEEYGGYYAWGETEEKSDYTWSNYKWCKGSETSMTKYCTSSSYGTVDNKTLLAPEDDVAHVKWGDGWRMPTRAEQDELRDNCAWVWTTRNGVNGYKVISKTNGNSIFLPAAGYRNGSEVHYIDSYGYCWSSSLYGSDSHSAYYLNFSSDVIDYFNGGFRYYGRSVRPVYGEPVEKYTVTVMHAGGGSVAISGNSGASATFEAGSSVTVVATPDDGYEFDGWYVDGVSVSTNLEYTFTISENIALVAKFKEEYSPTGSVDGHAYVDLGLPSGVKWATCNIGATKPEEYGGDYAWGETEEKEDYSWSTYKWFSGNIYSNYTFTKYNTNTSMDVVDNKTVLEPEDDVAHVKWGGSWRMPTLDEQKELLNNCTWTWTTKNGVNGYRVTGSNGNSIFLPAAGNSGSYGRYWSSSLYSSESHNAYYLNFNSGAKGYYKDYRCDGFSVRPVSD